MNNIYKNVHDLSFPQLMEKLEWLAHFPLGISEVCKYIQSSVAHKIRNV